MRGLIRGSVIIALAIASLPRIAEAQAPPASGAQIEPFLSGLDSPLYVTSARDGTNRLFVLEQPGRIKVVQPGSTTPTVFLDITGRVFSGGERGLLGLAFHPNYEVNRRFFVNYTRQPDGATVIAEYLASANPNVASTAERVILSFPQPFANHNGGMAEFGPDGFLYIGSGDGGSANDPGNRAQNVNELLGKILRIDIDHPSPTAPYSSPSSNPFFGAIAGRDEIYALGMRNPWRFSFDRGTGRLFVADVGQNAREEVDVVVSGGNYGWRVFEGSLCTNLDPCTNPERFMFPIAEYAHSLGRCSITGGYVYRGTRGTFAPGTYLVADFCTGEIFMLQGSSPVVLFDTDMNVSSFGEDEAGELFAVDLGGRVVRLVSACRFAISPTSQSFPAAGGTGSINVMAPAGCSWTATSNVFWVPITVGARGTGNGTVEYSVARNGSTSPRTGTITVAGLRFTVTQAGTSSTTCSVSVSPRFVTFRAAGGTGTLAVSAPASCSWTAATNVGWITITSGSPGMGNGSVGYRVAQNTTRVSRRATITVGGRAVTVWQSGS